MGGGAKEVKKAHFEQMHTPTPMRELGGFQEDIVSDPQSPEMQVFDNIAGVTQEGIASSHANNLPDAPRATEVVDEDLVRLDDLISMRIPLLRDLCRLQGLSIEGDRQDLVERLNAVYEPLSKRM